MLWKIVIACLLVAATVFVHAIGLAALLRALTKSSAPRQRRFWPSTWLLIRVVWALILIHLIEIAIWALFYLWSGRMPDAGAAFYFSGVTYTTIGYGDLLLSEAWRILAPVEGLTGILMCGLSTGVFFVVVGKLFWDPFPEKES